MIRREPRVQQRKNRQGRPHQIDVHLSDVEHRALHGLMHHLDMTASEVVRHLLLAAHADLARSTSP